MKKRRTDTLPIITIEDNFDNETAVLEYQKTKDKELLQKIVIQNLPLVIKMSEKYWFPSRISRNELFSEGSIGLIEAIQTYVEGDTKFSTYATNMITYAMLDCASEWYGEGSRYLGSIIMRYRKLAISIFGDNSHIYDENIVDYILGIMLEEGTVNSKSIKEIRLRLISKNIEQLQEEVEYVEDNTFQEENEEKEESKETLFIRLHKDELFEGLSEKRKAIMEYRFGFKDGHPHYQDEVAAIYGVSRQAIQQQEKKAMAKIIKKAMEIKGKENEE